MLSQDVDVKYHNGSIRLKRGFDKGEGGPWN